MKNIIRILKCILTISIIIGLLYFYDNYDKLLNNKTTQEKKIINDELEIYYIDVGQADSTLIKYKDTNILIDAGNNKDGQKLVKFFQELEINHFNYLITTHAHEDHIGGMDDILKNFEVDHFLIPSPNINTTSYQEVINLLEEKQIKKETPRIDEEIKIDNLNLKILWIGDSLEDINQNSIIIKLNYKNTKYLFPSDCSSDIENKILEKDLQSNVLKVGHHGSKYSSSAHFLKKVSPQYAIISVGKINDYYLPHEIVLKKLEKMNIKVFRTDQDGTIHLKSDGENIEIETLKTDTNQE